MRERRWREGVSAPFAVACFREDAGLNRSRFRRIFALACWRRTRRPRRERGPKTNLVLRRGVRYVGRSELNEKSWTLERGMKLLFFKLETIKRQPNKAYPFSNVRLHSQITN